MKLKCTTITSIVLLALIALSAGIFLSQQVQSKKNIDLLNFHGAYLEPSRSIKPFQLKGTDLKSFNSSSLQGQWTLMFFGFTNCGSICPVTMSKLSAMYRILEKKGVKQLPQVVMVTLDPDRDSLKKLKTYVTSFHKAFYGARGEESAITAMTNEMGIVFAKVASKNQSDSQDYDVQHSGALMLFNPQGQLNAFFTTPHHAKLLAEDYMLLVSNR